MPELPEVETIVTELNAALPGRAVTEARVFRDNALGGVPVKDFREALAGRVFERVRRRGKFLVFDFRDGGHLVGHLRMTGKFILSPPDAQPHAQPHAHHRVWFHLDDGGLLIFQDARCFGTLAIVERLADHAPLQRLGVEPLSPGFTAKWVAAALQKSKTPLKIWLMDQTRIAGLGNIYASEILFRAGLSPMRPAHTVTGGEPARLHRATRRILREAIRHNGTTISDFRRVDEKTGGFQDFLQVYGKQGEPCPRCRAPIVQARQQQRSTFFCRSCQK